MGNASNDILRLVGDVSGLGDGSTTGHRLGPAVVTLAPRAPGPPQHRHAKHEEGFYVISGTVRFSVGDLVHDAIPGTLVMVPAGAPYAFANLGDEPAVMLSTFTPDRYVQYFRDVAEVGRTTPEIMARYATEISTEYAEESRLDGTGRVG